MTQTAGDLWARLRRPLLDPRGRFAWAAPVFGDLRLRIEGVDRPLEELFARIVYNDAERESLAVGFSEASGDKAGCDILVRVQRVASAVRLEVALAGRLSKTLSLGQRRLAEHPGAGDGPPGSLQGPFESAAVLHV